MEDEKSFSYTYSAEQQEEVRRIRQKYLAPEEDRMEQLRRLDESVTRPGWIAALTVGILSTLLLGLGMSCTMVWDYFLPGIGIGVLGLAGIAAAYPLYRTVTDRQRKRLAPKIMELSRELMGEE